MEINISIDEMLALLGTKEAELYVLRKQIAQLTKIIEQLTPKPPAGIADATL